MTTDLSTAKEQEHCPCSNCGALITDHKKCYQHRIGNRVFCGSECRKQKRRQEVEAMRRSGTYIAGYYICANCRKEFFSRIRKQYCSMACYIGSSDFQKRIREQCQSNIAHAREAANHPEDEKMVLKVCPHCQKSFELPFGRRGTHKYCSRACRRAYFSARFDRWVANPERIALPQCYDEFLTKEELPCLIEGCEWIGKFLGTHVNVVHGISAEEFKRLAGFNHTTGLVSIDLHKAMSERAKREDFGHQAPIQLPIFTPASLRRPARLEGKEHASKSRAIKIAEAANPEYVTPIRSCRRCGAPVLQPVFGRRLYCSTRCRSAWYDRKQYPLTCAHCGRRFKGNRTQFNRASRQLPVCCDADCRNARNMSILLASRGLCGSIDLRHLRNLRTGEKGNEPRMGHR